MTTPVNTTAQLRQSDLATAIDTLRAGQRLPQSLVMKLREQGYDIVGLHTAYLNKKA